MRMDHLAFVQIHAKIQWVLSCPFHPLFHGYSFCSLFCIGTVEVFGRCALKHAMFLCSQQKLHQLRSKSWQIPRRRLFSARGLKTKHRPPPQRTARSKLKPRTQTGQHRHRRRRQLLSSLPQRKSFALIFFDFYSTMKTELFTTCEQTVTEQSDLSRTFFVTEKYGDNGRKQNITITMLFKTYTFTHFWSGLNK